ncbi:MAG: PQQ-binding-like beta-propeller repeat protein [Verrucomicrobiales bacterium]
MKALIPFVLFVAFLLFPAPLPAEDWPHWRGPARDGSTSESSGWEEGAWPPVEVWSADVGYGSSSVLEVGGKVYGIGHRGDGETVFCLDAATGKALWEQNYKAPDYGREAVGDQNFYTGPSATPEFDPETGLLFTQGIDGDLHCWDTKADGKPVWALNLYDAFGTPQRPQVTKRANSRRDYGCPTAPLVQGRLLIIGAGDSKHGNVLAFDKTNGHPVWSSQNKDAAGHAGGLVPVSISGKPCVVSLTATQVVVTELSAGREVCAYPWATDFINNIPTPAILRDGSIVVTSNYNISATAALAPGAVTMRSVWKCAESSGVCSPVVDGDALYLGSAGLRCLDARTGKVRWSGGKFGDACSVILTGDKRLIVWANDGDLALIEGAGRSPSAFKLLAERKGILRDMAWPHVVLAGGRLFCKDRAGNLKCLALGKTARAQIAKAPPVIMPLKPAAAEKFDLTHWPANDTVLAWKKGRGKRGFLGSLANTGRWILAANGDATFEPDGSLLASGGGFPITGDMESLSGVFKKAGALTIEVIFTAADIEQTGPARILTFSESGYARNFTLGQEKDALILRLRTPATGANGMNPQTVLTRIEPARLYHCLISYGNGTLACYLNGAEVYRETGHVTGDFSNWSPQKFVIANEWKDPRPWRGRVEGVALFTTPTDAATAARRWKEMAR